MMHSDSVYHLSTSAHRACVLDAVDDERDRQDAKWGQQNHPDGTGPEATFFGIPAAELAEYARRMCDASHADGQGSYAGILLEEVFEALAESDPAKLRAELVQSAAVAVAWVEAIDRRAVR